MKTNAKQAKIKRIFFGFFFRWFVRTVCMLRLKDSTVANDIYVGFARFSF